MSLLDCSACGQTNRIPALPKGRVKCAKCHRPFSIKELTTARPEPPPTRVAPGGLTLSDLDEECSTCGSAIDPVTGDCPECDELED